MRTEREGTERSKRALRDNTKSARKADLQAQVKGAAEQQLLLHRGVLHRVLCAGDGQREAVIVEQRTQQPQHLRR